MVQHYLVLDRVGFFVSDEMGHLLAEAPDWLGQGDAHDSIHDPSGVTAEALAGEPEGTMVKSGPTQSGQSHEYVLLMRARNLTDAEFFKGLLVSRNIPAIISDEASESIGIPSSLFGDGVPLLVPDQMLEGAKRAIQTVKQAGSKD